MAATKPADFGGAVVAFMNAGGVRADFTFPSSSQGEGNGNVTYGEGFTVQPFGNSLVTMTVTAQNIKDVLEQQFANCLGQISSNRIMHVSAGFKYSWDSTKTCGSRISNVRLVDTASGVLTEQIVNPEGSLPDAGKTYRITVNNFMATGGDNFFTFLNGTNLLGGAQDIDSLVTHLGLYKAPLTPYDPTLPALQKPRITRLP